MKRNVCSAWETSTPEGGNELRARIGLQFFAEDGDGGADGADMDGTGMDGFLDGLGTEESGGAEDQRAAEGATAEAESGSEDQTAGQAGNEAGNTAAGEQPPAGGNAEKDPAQEPQTAPPVTLRFMDRQYQLPSDAMQAISQALGADARTLLQKGMNYDNKGRHEMGVLEQYAAAAGMELPQYLALLEKTLPEHEKNIEMEALRTRYPGADEKILGEIAQKNIDLRHAQREKARAERAQAAARETARVNGMRENIRKQAEQLRQDAEVREWTEYVKTAGITDKSQIPKELIEMVQTEKISPMLAHYKMQAAAARQEAENAKKEAANHRSTPGSLRGAADEHDDFLSGLFG